MNRTSRQAGFGWLNLLVAVVILAAFVLQVGLDDWRWLIAAIALVWVVEALNTGLEHIADATCPEDNALIGIAKDVGAGATLIAAIAAALIGAITFAPYVLRQWPA